MTVLQKSPSASLGGHCNPSTCITRSTNVEEKKEKKQKKPVSHEGTHNPSWWVSAARPLGFPWMLTETARWGRDTAMVLAGWSVASVAMMGARCGTCGSSRTFERHEFVSIRGRSMSDEKDIHDEDGLQNHCSLMIIENGPQHHEI